MNAKELIGSDTPSTFTNAELTERILKLESIVALLSDRLSVVDGKDFYMAPTTTGPKLTCEPKETIPVNYTGA